MEENNKIALYNAVDAFRLLSEDHQKFVLGMVGGDTPKQAALRMNPAFKPDKALRVGNNLLKNHTVINAITQLGHYRDDKIDTGAEAMIKRAIALFGQMQQKGMSDKNYDTAIKIFDQINKIKGNYKASDHSSSTGGITPVQIIIQSSNNEQRVIDVTGMQDGMEFLEGEEKPLLDPPPSEADEADQNIEDFLNDPA